MMLYISINKLILQINNTAIFRNFVYNTKYTIIEYKNIAAYGKYRLKIIPSIIINMSKQYLSLH